ncbi:MAG: FG-GAP repeat protein, partial [Planctomycetota bacterium]
MLTAALTASTLLLAPQATQVRHLHDSDSAHSEAGRAVAPAGDWNSDGVDDYAVGAPWASPDFVGSYDDVGEVQIVSGTDGSLLASIPGPSTTLPDYNFGWSVAGPFDFNGNGTAEIAVGNRYGRVDVYEPLPNLPSFATLVLTYEPLNTFSLLFEAFGQTLVNLGDLTGDGRNEIGIGDPLADILISPFLFDDGGVIQIFDGDGFSLLRTYTPGGLASSGGEFGRAMTRVADMDGNGLGDVAVGAPGSENDGGRVFVFDF